VPVRVRLVRLKESAVHGVKVTAAFMATAPVKVVRFFSQPWDVQRSTYARWWVVIKKEAKHYWVSAAALRGSPMPSNDCKAAWLACGRMPAFHAAAM
jgi:hypothetical protein